MNGSVEHHGPGDGHDGLDCSFGVAIVVMSTDTGEAEDLFESGEFLLELGRSKAGSVVGEERRWGDSMIAAHLFELGLGFECLMRRHVLLELDMDVVGGMVNKQTPTNIHFFLWSLAF